MMKVGLFTLVHVVLLISAESIKDAASTAVYAMMTYYKGNETGQIPGAFSTKWWEGSTLFLALLQYWHFTGDTTYNDELRVGLEWQSGTNGDYMPSNYSIYLVRHPREISSTSYQLCREMTIKCSGDSPP